MLETNNKTKSYIAKLAFCATFFCLCVIGLGAFTRLMDAGLGCPDWPGCYGHLIAPLNDYTAQVNNYVSYKAWAEMVHRYFAGTLSILIISIIILIFSRSVTRTRSNIIFAVILIGLILYQIMLGLWTVTLKLLPIVVTQHLMGGFLIASTLWLVYLTNRNNLILKNNNPNLVKILPWAVGAVVILFLQIMLGAWTSTNYASLSCPDFPFCVNSQAMSLHLREAFALSPVGINYEGGVLSTVIRQTIHMMHRLGGLIFTLYLIMFAAYALPKLKNSFEILKSIYLVFGLLCIQLCIGISNVIFKLPLITAVAHTLVAILLLLSLLTFVCKLVLSIRQGHTS
ncbi:MAG: COX15/CtaA family protein [Gammaproteobacteria bacterium]|nr:COX15/CtaA family protein [Gammaproteobacteria bacterium]